MPLIRYIYDRDIAKHGATPVNVLDVEARVLVADRRAELVAEVDGLDALKRDELADHAKNLGIDVKAADTKAEIIKNIEAVAG